MIEELRAEINEAKDQLEYIKEQHPRNQRIAEACNLALSTLNLDDRQSTKRWIRTNQKNILMCPDCSRTATISNYCPHCGVRLRGIGSGTKSVQQTTDHRKSAKNTSRGHQEILIF